MAFQKPQNIARGIAPTEVKVKTPVASDKSGYEVRLKQPLPQFGGLTQFNSRLDPTVQIKLSVEFRTFMITKGDDTYHVPFENIVYFKQLK